MGGYYLNEESYNEGVFCCIGCFNVGICYCVIDCLIIGLNVNINVGEIVFFFYWASDIVVYQLGLNMFGGCCWLCYNIDLIVIYYDGVNNCYCILSCFYNIDNENDFNQSNFLDMFYVEYQFQCWMVVVDLVFIVGLVGLGMDIEVELYGDIIFIFCNLVAYV